MDFETGKQAVGQSVSRTEDPRLLRGEGRYTDDVNLPGQAHAYILRSAVAHGEIRSIDTAVAAGMPGVLAVYTGTDLRAAGYGPQPCIVQLKNRDGSDLKKPDNHALAMDRVRYVGHPLAAVIAETAAQARDAAEAIDADIEELPAVDTVEATARPEAPQIWPEAPGNVCLDFENGDQAAVDAAFDKADHVSRLKIVNNRIVIAPTEPRAAVASYDGRFTLYIGCQGPFASKNTLANRVLNLPPEQVRVIVGNVGGSFGMKSPVYPEYVAILHATRELGRPVKWCDVRSDSFLSDQHGRDSVVEAALALDKDGNFLAARVDGMANMGAALSAVGPQVQVNNIFKNLPSVYKVPLIAITTKCYFTNTSPIGAYRGAGRPEVNYYMERLIEFAARRMGRDPVELRRQNLVPAAEMPYTTASGQLYDSGDFPGVLEKGIVAADWQGYEARRSASRAAGKLRGRGLSCYLEATAPSGKEMGGITFEDDGTVSLITGTLDYGQGHAAPFAQVLADQLGVPFEKIRLRQGDSDQLIVGGGTGGSRSIMASGTAAILASDEVKEKARRLAAEKVETAVEDIEFDSGILKIAGTDRGVSLLELAQTPEGRDGALDAALAIDTPPSTYPNGVHVCELEIDPETGAVRVDRYTAVDDFGVMVNPAIVEGQVHGGVAQGIGQALMEHAVYDGQGQLLSGSFMDYAMPRADQIPSICFDDHPSPATSNPLGVKGCGEAGCSGSLPAVMNAIVDALAPYGVEHIDMPATPEKIWRAVNSAK
jgi:carbon-monoxide dehydrogenase large subunit